MAENVRDKVWLTAHIRMGSERRLRRLSFVLKITTIWYSTVLTCLTVYQLIAPKSIARDGISAALAIILLAFSIFIPSLDLDRQAEKFRECYLKLQRLLDTETDINSINISYHNILEAYPNHWPQDQVEFVVNSRMSNQFISSSDRPILPTLWMYIEYISTKIAARMGFLILLLAPGLLYYII